MPAGCGEKGSRPVSMPWMRGHHRPARAAPRRRGTGAVGLVVAATAESQGSPLPHRDRDFECIAAVTGQALQRYGPEAGE